MGRKPVGVPISFKIPQEWRDDLQEVADDEYEGQLSLLVRRILREWLEGRSKKK